MSDNYRLCRSVWVYVMSLFHTVYKKVKSGISLLTIVTFSFCASSPLPHISFPSVLPVWVGDSLRQVLHPEMLWLDHSGFPRPRFLLLFNFSISKQACWQLSGVLSLTLTTEPLAFAGVYWSSICTVQTLSLGLCIGKNLAICYIIMILGFQFYILYNVVCKWFCKQSDAFFSLICGHSLKNRSLYAAVLIND